MKDVNEWDEAYILNSFSKGEFDQIEFKGRAEIDLTLPGITDINRSGFAKELSALVNYGGGYLILGINDKTRQVDDGGIDVSIKNGTKAWLENVLPRLTDLPLIKFNVKEIPKENSQSSLLTNRAIYVVEIKESPIAPHQSAIDYRYYTRVATNSVPIGHQLVMDILNRKQHPSLELHFHYARVSDSDPNLHVSDGNHFVLSVQVENTGKIFAKYVNCIIYIPDYLVHPAAVRQPLMGTPTKREDGKNYIIIGRENVILETKSREGIILEKGPGRYAPILPTRKHEWDIPLCDDFETKKQFFKKDSNSLYWELYADNAEPIKGEVSLTDISFCKHCFIS